MQAVGKSAKRFFCLTRWRPASYLYAALVLGLLITALRPTSVADDLLIGPDVTATGIVQRPTYGFDPGQAFFSLSPGEDGPRLMSETAIAASVYTTYRQDTGPGFFDLIETDDQAKDAAADEIDMLSRLFDAPLPQLSRYKAPAADLPNDGILRLRVEDFGAVADAAVDNRKAIQDAIDYAHALGGGVIHLKEGTYGVAGDPRSSGAIKLKSNTFLQGAGMGHSVLRLMDGWSGQLTGLVRTPPGEDTVNFGIADLTLDGNRAGTDGKVDAYYSGGKSGTSIMYKDAWILRVEARDFSGQGFNLKTGTRRMTIADSIARGNANDGFVASAVISGVYRRNIAIGNGRHGFNITGSTNDILFEDSIAHRNGGSGLVVQRGGDGKPQPHNLRIARMRLTDNQREGLLLRMSRDISVSEIFSSENGTYGVRVQGSRAVLLSDSMILDNSLSERGKYAAVQIRAEDDPVTDLSFPVAGVVVRDNVIGWRVPTEQRSAVHEVKGNVAGTVISGNRFRGFFRDTVRLGSRSTVSQNHRLEPARLFMAFQGFFKGRIPIGESLDCQNADIRPSGCDFPRIATLWPEGLK